MYRVIFCVYWYKHWYNTKSFSHADAILITLKQHLHINKISFPSSSSCRSIIGGRILFPSMIYNSLFQDHGRGNKFVCSFKKLSLYKEAFNMQQQMNHRNIILFFANFNLHTNVISKMCHTSKTRKDLFSCFSLKGKNSLIQCS